MTLARRDPADPGGTLWRALPANLPSIDAASRDRDTADEGTEPGRVVVLASTAKLRSYLAALDRATHDEAVPQLPAGLARRMTPLWSVALCAVLVVRTHRG